MSELRTKLAELGNAERFEFRAEVKYTSVEEAGYNKYGCLCEKPILFLKNVMMKIGDEWVKAADKLKLNYTKQFKEYGLLNKYQEVYFSARVTRYNSETGKVYEVKFPSKVSVFEDGVEVDKTDEYINMKEVEFVDGVKLDNYTYFDVLNSFKSLFDKRDVCVFIGEDVYLSFESLQYEWNDREDMLKMLDDIVDGRIEASRVWGYRGHYEDLNEEFNKGYHIYA